MAAAPYLNGKIFSYRNGEVPLPDHLAFGLIEGYDLLIVEGRFQLEEIIHRNGDRDFAWYSLDHPAGENSNILTTTIHVEQLSDFANKHCDLILYHKNQRFGNPDNAFLRYICLLFRWLEAPVVLGFICRNERNEVRVLPAYDFATIRPLVVHQTRAKRDPVENRFFYWNRMLTELMNMRVNQYMVRKRIDDVNQEDILRMTYQSFARLLALGLVINALVAVFSFCSMLRDVFHAHQAVEFGALMYVLSVLTACALPIIDMKLHVKPLTTFSQVMEDGTVRFLGDDSDNHKGEMRLSSERTTALLARAQMQLGPEANLQTGVKRFVAQKYVLGYHSPSEARAWIRELFMHLEDILYDTSARQSEQTSMDNEGLL